MVKIDLGKLRFSFAGDYDPNAIYEINDMVKFGANVYAYIYPLKTKGVVPTDKDHWQIVVTGYVFVGEYDAARAYKMGDGVTVGANLFVCAVEDTAVGTSPFDPAHWNLLMTGIRYMGEFDPAALYHRNDLITYQGKLYVSKNLTTGHLPTDTVYFDKLIEGISAQGVYNSATTYFQNTVVAYGPTTYISLKTVQGVVPSSDPSSWQEFSPGMRFANDWVTAHLYFKNEVVTRGNTVYVCRNEHTSTTFAADIANWRVLMSGVRFTDEWASATQYGIYDIVTRGGQSFIAKADHASADFATDLAAGKWGKFNGGIRWRGVWASGTSYLANDMLYDGNGSSYIVPADYVSGASVTADLTANKLSMISKGATVTVNGIPPMSVATKGKNLSNDGTNLKWVPSYTFQNYVDLTF